MTDNGLRTFIPFYLAGLGMGPALIGAYLAVVQGAGLVASPLSGWMSDRFGRKPLVAGGMLATTIIVVVFANLSFISILAWQASRGESIMQPGTLTLEAFGLWAAIKAAAAAVCTVTYLSNQQLLLFRS